MGQVIGEAPAPDEGQQDDKLADQAGLLGADAIGEKAHHDAEERTTQDGDSDQNALLASRQPEISGDIDAQRTDEHPDHETDIKIQEGTEQRRGVSRAGKVA